MSRILGDLRQNGYVVKDIESAMKHWTERMGVGPFFYIEEAPIGDFVYRGEPTEAKASIALTNSGPVQIELIQQRNDAPSIYKDFLDAGYEGLQHVAYWTETFDVDLERMRELGFAPIQSGYAGGPDGRFVYFEEQGHPGTMIELSEVSGAKGKFFEHIRDTANGWDGSDPIRRI